MECFVAILISQYNLLLYIINLIIVSIYYYVKVLNTKPRRESPSGVTAYLLLITELLAVLDFRSTQRVAHQHGDGHRANTTR